MPAVPRVLLLEDELLIAMMVRDWLTEIGCATVGPAHTVPSALALIEDGPLDGAILDVSIGSQDCSPVAAALRNKGIPFALATGHALDGLAATYADALSLSKPYDFAAVQTVVAKLLDGHGTMTSPAEPAPSNLR
jgi:CheY-like chemotaxis protein